LGAADDATDFLTTAHDLPERDFELHVATLLIGTMSAIYPCENLHIKADFAVKMGIGKACDLVDRGFFLRAEVGPEIDNFATCIDNTDDLQNAVETELKGLQPKATFACVRPYYNLVYGIVI
jgi:hypothetical protein